MGVLEGEQGKEQKEYLKEWKLKIFQIYTYNNLHEG